MAVVADATGALRERPWQATIYLGMALFLVSETFLFGSLFWTYFYLAGRNPVWPSEGADLPIVLPSINTAFLLASSLTVYWATKAIRRGDQAGLVAGLLATIFLGSIFLSLTGWEWTHVEFRPWDHAYGSIFYTLTGFHAVHVLGGLLLLTTLAVRAARGRFSPDRQLAVEVGGLYWHFVDMVWVGVFISIFVIQ